MDKLYHLGVNLEFWDVIVDRGGGGGGGVMVFCFVQNLFSDNTRVRIFIFFVAQSANFFSRI
jgi:hypothetical protein